MASETEIANLALSHLGTAKEIANLETEQSQEASACRRYYDISRDATLRDFPWPFATKIIAVGLVEEDPNDEWDYSYRVPSDCVKVRRILSGDRVDNVDTQEPYRIVHDDSGALIYTDKEDAEIEYTLRVEDPGLYPSDFTMALSYRLAMYIAPRLTAGDPYRLGDKVMRLYEIEISRARATSVNEERIEKLSESEFMKARE